MSIDSSQSAQRGSISAPLWALAALMLALTWPVIFHGGGNTSEAFDQNEFHLPVIRQFASQWPSVDLTSYKSATSPGYHLLLAAVDGIVGGNLTALRLASSLFGVGLVLVVAQCACGLACPKRAVMLTLPLACSTYVLGGAIWLTTDNLAWLLVACSLGLLVMRERNARRSAGASVCATIAVFVRQLHVWLIGPLAVAIAPQARSRPLLFAAFLAGPILVLAWLAWMWKGLTPPGFAVQHASGFNPAAAVLTLALLGAFGPFFTISVPRHNRPPALGDPLVRIAALAAGLLAVALPTSFDREAGRWGGAIWTIVERTPAVWDRSLVMVALAALGGGALAALWRAADDMKRGRNAGLLLLGLVAWQVAQCANAQAWQRYAEPMVLMTLAWLTALTEPPRVIGPPGNPLRRAGPIALAVIQLLAAFLALYRPTFS